MSQQTYLHGTVIGDGKEYTIGPFRADLLEAKQQKYQAKGAVLSVWGKPELAPNPNPVRTERSGARDEGLKHEHIGSRPSGRKADQTPARGGRREVQLKPIVCLTNSKYYICTTDAALELNLAAASICAHINHPDKHKQVKGYVFRRATEAENTVRRMLA